MFEYTENNKRTVYITAPEAITSYMMGYRTTTLTKEDFITWSGFLKDFLSDETTTAHVISGEEALKELDRDDYLFNITNEDISLKQCYDIGDAKIFLDQIPLDLYVKLLNAPIVFTQQNDESEMQ